MRVLLIKPKQIGDSLILAPVIRALRDQHGAEVWVVVRRGCEGILEGCPDIARILTVAPVEKRDRQVSDLWNDFKTFCALRFARFDHAFELGDGSRGRWLVRLARAGARYSVKPGEAGWAARAATRAGCKIATFDWQTCHRVEKDYQTVHEFLPLAQPPGPMIFSPEARRQWEPAAALADFAVLQVGTRQGFNRWHRDGWRSVAAGLLERFAHVVVTCGPDAGERAEAAWLQSELGSRVLTTDGRASWPQMAWLLGRARLFVGPNTAAMHLASACGCPVVALFGPSIEDHWHPWRVPYRIVTPPGDVTAADPRERYARIKQRRMLELRCEDVLAACDALMSPSAAVPAGR